MLTLTQDEIDALNAEYCALQSSVASRTQQLLSQVDVIADATDVDNAQNKVFDLYDTDIILAYEKEREQLDGTHIDTPVTLAELDNLGTLDPTNRLLPINPITNPTRIAQFDGTPLITTDNEIAGIPSDPLSPVVVDNEAYRIARQAEREDWLQNGFGGTSPTITATTFIVGAITPSTTQITVQTTTEVENALFAVGNTFVALEGGKEVGILITNIVSQINGAGGFCTPTATPDTEAQCGIEGGDWTFPTNYEAVLDVVILTTLSLGTDATIDENWAGFSNSDRTAKVDSTDGYTDMLLDLIDDLEDMIDERIVKLDAQKTQLQLNQDPNLASSAETNVDTSKTAMNAWKATKLVTDTDLTTLASERGVRSPQITARITAIGTAITTPTNFFDLRYTAAVDKGDTSRGTARVRIFREDTGGVGGTIATFKAQEEARIQAIEDILTLAGEPIPTCT